eukprot:6817924-Prymnesium_polylepis.2
MATCRGGEYPAVLMPPPPFLIWQAERHEEALRGRLRAMHAAAQDELEQKSHGLMALHDSQLHQLRVDHA